jgi:hypothetical protein
MSNGNIQASSFRKLLDFAFGALLFGVAPMSVFAVVIFIGELLHRFSTVVIPHSVGYAIGVIVYALALLAFVGAFVFRLRRRMSPRGFIVAEVVLGIIGAIVIFFLYLVLMRSLIDWEYVHVA